MGDSEAGMDNVPLVDKEASSAVAGVTAWDRLILSVRRGDKPETSLSQGVYVGEALPPMPLKLAGITSKHIRLNKSFRSDLLWWDTF